MRKIRKTATLLLALVMILSLAAPAFAAEVATTYSITINNEENGHLYEAYQIFKGELSDGVLSNIEWGDSVANADELGDAAAVAKKLDENYTGEDAITVEDLLDMIELGEKVADSGETSNPYVISGLEAGYYLVKDQDGSLDGKDDAYTEYIIKVVGNVETAPKSDVPEFVKKVKDINDSEDADISDNAWQDSADHDIGDEVPFQLTATLANNVSAYDTYKVVFHDTLSDGLTFNADSVKVYVDGELVTTGYTVVENPTDGCTFEVVITDAKAMGATDSSVITVEYTATLNDQAVLGAAGNPNVANLEYSNNPNWDGEGEEDTGETPDDKVIVFTYKVVVNKVDQDGEALEGAGFTLYKKNAAGEYVAVGEELKGDALTTFEWTHLDDGDYKLVETTTPAGYNTIDDIEFTITAEHEILSDNPALTALSGDVTSGEATFTASVPDGSLTTDVVNQSGATLPETGGIGTTIFYVLGAVMVLGAAVLLVTKKRMAA